MTLRVIVEDKNGNRREAPAQGSRLAPGERVVGVVHDADYNRVVNTETTPEMKRILKYLDSIEMRGGFKLGDKIAFLTHALGIEECPRCQAWRQILNRVHEIGWWKAFKLMLAAARQSKIQNPKSKIDG